MTCMYPYFIKLENVKCKQQIYKLQSIIDIKSKSFYLFIVCEIFKSSIINTKICFWLKDQAFIFVNCKLQIVLYKCTFLQIKYSIYIN